MNLLVIAGAKLPPLLRYSSFLAAFFYSFFDLGFKLLNTRVLKTKVFSPYNPPQSSPKKIEALRK